MGIYQKQPSSRLGRSIVKQIASAQTNATQFTTPFAANTHQVRVASTLGLWATIGSTAVVTANSAATFIPANVPEYGSQLHFDISLDRLRHLHGDGVMSGDDVRCTLVHR
jgi:hypothetical protein